MRSPTRRNFYALKIHTRARTRGHTHASPSAPACSQATSHTDGQWDRGCQTGRQDDRSSRSRPAPAEGFWEALVRQSRRDQSGHSMDLGALPLASPPPPHHPKLSSQGLPAGCDPVARDGCMSGNDSEGRSLTPRVHSVSSGSENGDLRVPLGPAAVYTHPHCCHTHNGVFRNALPSGTSRNTEAPLQTCVVRARQQLFPRGRPLAVGS